MKVQAEQYDVAAVVGRFQVHELHEAHVDLIESVASLHPRVIVFLGLSPVVGTKNNPLDYEARRRMLAERFPDIDIHYIRDEPSNYEWSVKLDRQIAEVTNPNQRVVLCGSRDSFINHYEGKYDTQELVQEVWISGTETRKAITNKVKGNSDFRAGAIWATALHPDRAIPAVAVGVFNEEKTHLLMVRHTGDKRLSLPMRDARPDSSSYEADARWIAQEDLGLAITDPEYAGSGLVDDWRYRGEADKIKATVFRAQLLSGRLQGGDGIAEARWVKVDDIQVAVSESHYPLVKMLLSVYPFCHR